jgi:adenosylcobinamide kinase/adenosylcobinamide-phosphate guanylyltransferase
MVGKDDIIRELVLVTGGARSGKSSFAEGLMMEKGHRILYIATSIPLDQEMEYRIARHRAERPAFWQTLEAYSGIRRKLGERGDRFHGIILDCITVMLTNLMLDFGIKPDIWDPELNEAVERAILREVNDTIKGIRTWGDTGVIVSNEVGMGLVPDSPFARVFRDLAGRVNQMIAAEADRVIMMVSGIPMRIK